MERLFSASNAVTMGIQREFKQTQGDPGKLCLISSLSRKLEAILPVKQESQGVPQFIAILMLVFSVVLVPAAEARAKYSRVEATQQAQQQTVQIAGVQIDDSTQALRILADKPFASSGASQYSIIKLPSPYRLVLDIPQSRLMRPDLAKVISVKQNGIREVEVSQNSGPYYNGVRVVVYVDDAKTLWKLNPSLQDNSLVLSRNVETALKPDGVTKATDMPLPPPGRQIVEAIDYKDDQLLISAQKGDELKIKNRFPLSGPTRLVLELENTAVASKDLLKMFTYRDDNGTPRRIRVGQFDESTVRVVIETDKPDAIQAFYPGTDKHRLAISDKTDVSASTLPADVALGQLSNVIVGKRDGKTTIRLTTSTPIVHRLTRNNDNVKIELLNIAAQPQSVKYLKSAFPELQSVRLDSLTAGQPNSKLLIDLKQEGTDISVDIAEDGKTLDLVFGAPGVINIAGSKGDKAPFPARVVIDAGHGGKDLGANRDGVYEKDLNLQVLFRLKAALEKRGVKVFMTRSTDVFLPLPQITQIANDYHPDLFVSVHQNASTNPGLNGIETYYYTAQSLPLARKVHARMIAANSAPDRGVRRAMFYVIHHTAVPAILCEVGYISNSAERRELQSAQRQQNTADAIADGVVDYLKTRVSAQAGPKLKP